MRVEGMVELASGIDALYLSGRAALEPDLLDLLDDLRTEAQANRSRVDLVLGTETFVVEPGGFGKYRFRLSHPNGIVGITGGSRLPALRVQPRAEFLHGVGAAGAVEWFRQVLDPDCGPIAFSVSRLDVHADWQGWVPSWEDRERFVGRWTEQTMRAEGDVLTGWEFGRRSTATVVARIYDKTREVDVRGNDYWFTIWGAGFDRSRPVVRVEFEFGRQALREYGVDSPEDAIGSAGALWADVTANWLTYRSPTGDATPSRWPIAPEWAQVQRSSLADEAFGIERMRGGRRRGSLRLIAPALTGYLARIAALTGVTDLDGAVGAARGLVEDYCRSTGVAFADRVASKRLELAR